MAWETYVNIAKASEVIYKSEINNKNEGELNGEMQAARNVTLSGMRNVLAMGQIECPSKLIHSTNSNKLKRREGAK